MSKAGIKKVVLDLDGKEIVLTIEQAKKLKKVLSEMFGKEIVKELIIKEKKYYDWFYPKPYYQLISDSSVKFSNNTVYCSV